MSKHKILTQDEIDEYKLNPILTQMIEDYISLQKLKRDQINVLDWGSGRGQTIAELRSRSYGAMESKSTRFHFTKVFYTIVIQLQDT